MSETNDGDVARPGGAEELKNARLTITMQPSLRQNVVALAKSSERSVSNYVSAILWDHVMAMRGSDDEG